MKIITSESVFSGHPDKMCDQISDAILDVVLSQDKNARVAIETAIKDDLVFIFGEVSTTAVISYKEVALKTIKEIGYNEKFIVIEKISQQSPDIAAGVNKGSSNDQGAGDQGMMYGYACNETLELMPLPIMLAHKIAKQVETLRKKKYGHVFLPDGKCQVSVGYEKGVPKLIKAIVISAQTRIWVSTEQVRDIVIHEVINEVFKDYDIRDTKVMINPTGKFVIGGPYADSGLTGRKIIVDTYGGYAKHGGGAFSGKDVSKVDRSAAYYARFVAKSVVAAGLATRCEVCLSYVIGIADPISIDVDTFNTGEISDEGIRDLIELVFDFKPGSIRKELKLDNVKFKELATYGHFGRCDLNASWEQVDQKVIELKRLYEKG